MERRVFHQNKYSFGESKKRILGERRSKEEEQSQNLSPKRSKAQESGSVWWWAKESGRKGGSEGEKEMLSWVEGSPQTVRGPEGDTLGVLHSVAAPGPSFEETLP